MHNHNEEEGHNSIAQGDMEKAMVEAACHVQKVLDNYGCLSFTIVAVDNHSLGETGHVHTVVVSSIPSKAVTRALLMCGAQSCEEDIAEIINGKGQVLAREPGVEPAYPQAQQTPEPKPKAKKKAAVPKGPLEMAEALLRTLDRR